MAAAGGLDTKRYDRQIRLWGMETQLRMTTTRVLICGAGGLAAEVAKNLVLAGVGHVTLQDHMAVTEDDLQRGGQFLLGGAEVGANRAESSLSFLRGLNPSVEVTACTDDVRAATAEHLAQFDLAIFTELEIGEVVQLGLLAREARAGVREPPAKRARGAEDDGASGPAPRSVHVIGAGAAGLYGWVALDLGEYAYGKSSKTAGADGDVVTETSQANITYPSFEEALPNAASIKQPADLATVLAVQRALCSGEDMRTSVARTLKELHLPADTLSPAAIDALEPQAAPALAPVCAILGGLIGQEVIKVISAKDTPIDNFLVLDSVSPPPNSGARVIRLAPPPK